MRLLLVLLSSVFVMSCSTLSKEECQMGNWYDYGNRDANKGDSSTRYMKHAEACQEYGITVDRKQYMDGFNEGLKTFCTAENGYTYGLNGGRYQNTCPSTMAAKFKKAYNRGKQIFDIKSKISRLDNEIDSLSNEMTASTTTRDRRTAVMYELREKERKKSDLEKRLLVIELKDEIRSQMSQ